jgi:hypothetical protein
MQAINDLPKLKPSLRDEERMSNYENFSFVIWDLTFVIARKSPNVNWAFNQDILKQWRK